MYCTSPPTWRLTTRYLAVSDIAWTLLLLVRPSTVVVTMTFEIIERYCLQDHVNVTLGDVSVHPRPLLPWHQLHQPSQFQVQQSPRR